MHIAFAADVLLSLTFALIFWMRYKTAYHKWETPTLGYPMDKGGVIARRSDFRIVFVLALLFVLVAKGGDTDQQIWAGIIELIAGSLFTWSVIRD